MKNRISTAAVLLIIIATLCSCTTISNRRNIVGEWQDEDMRYVFDNDGYATVYMGEQVMGGSNLFETSSLKYEIDFTKTPITLDLIYMNKDSGKEHKRMAMIVRFMADDTIQIKTNYNDTRPEVFKDDDSDVLVLDRVPAP